MPVLERHRRSYDSPRTLVLTAPNLARNFTLELTPSRELLDPSFLLLRHSENRTEPLPLSLVERGCYFHSQGANQAAISVCGGVVSSRVLTIRETFLTFPFMLSVGN